MHVDRNGLEVLDREECLRLLASATLGRMGLTSGALPTVLPVTFRLVGDEIIVRTSRGSKLEAATNNAVVAFEVDDFDTLEHGGWSVVVTGIAREITDPVTVDRLHHLPIARWVHGEDARFVAISTELVSGRRLTSMMVR